MTMMRELKLSRKVALQLTKPIFVPFGDNDGYEKFEALAAGTIIVGITYDDDNECFMCEYQTGGNFSVALSDVVVLVLA